MPAYQNTPFGPKLLAQKGIPAYLFGTYDTRIGDSKLYVTNSALTSNVATVTVQQLSGPLPLVGSLISIINSTNGSGALNVSRAVITATTVSALTGAGTISFALTNANIATAADTGTVEIEPAEIPEALANGKSIACAVARTNSATDTTENITATVSFPSLPTTATVSLQGAIKDIDSEYVTLGTVGTVAGGAATATSLGFIGKYTFYRLLVASVTGGTSPSVIGKLIY